MQQELKQIFQKFIGDPYIPELRITDVVEILIIAVIVYEKIGRASCRERV